MQQNIYDYIRTDKNYTIFANLVEIFQLSLQNNIYIPPNDMFDELAKLLNMSTSELLTHNLIQNVIAEHINPTIFNVKYKNKQQYSIDDVNIIKYERYSNLNLYYIDGLLLSPTLLDNFTTSNYKQLKIATFNIAYNVHTNRAIGSEADHVYKCQQQYKGGWYNNKITQCAKNAAVFLSNYDIFGLQEISYYYSIEFQKTIQANNKQANYKFFPTTYFNDWSVVIGYDENVTGKGIGVYSNLIGDRKVDLRGIQALYFDKLRLLMINMHAPHNIDLEQHLKYHLQQIEYLSKPADIILMTGDFNDYKGTLQTKTFKIFNQYISIPEGKLHKSCCDDSDYIYPGDYIFTNKNEEVRYYGFAPSYVRANPLMSDHDPIIMNLKI